MSETTYLDDSDVEAKTSLRSTARMRRDEGFGLVEMVIAFFLLGLIAVAILPALISGIRYASEQSSAASATRAVNARIEQLRNNASVSCADLVAAASPGVTATDGRGGTFSITGPAPACGVNTHQQAVALTLNATASNATVLATVTAKIYLP